MSEARGHYQAFARKPAPGSDYEFFVEAFGILEIAPFFEQICRALRGAGEGSQWGHFAALREYVRKRYQAAAIEQLISGGMPRQRLAKLGDDTSILVEILIEAQISNLLAVYADAAWTRDLQHRVPARYRVMRAAVNAGGSGPKAALMLNQNSSRASRKLTKDHIRRGCQAYVRHFDTWIRGVATPVGGTCLVAAAVHVDGAYFEALTELRQQAKQRSELKAFKGKDLVRAIDDAFGLTRVVLKRASEVDQHRGTPLRTLSSIAVLEMASRSSFPIGRQAA